MTQKLTTFVHVVNPDTLENVVLEPGQTVPSWAKDQVTNPKAFEATDDEPTAAADETTDTSESDYDPASDDVDGVNNYLANADEDEVQRVLAAEAAGKNRKGIVEGPYAEVD
ncbi:hypothetical protein [Nocardioides aquiterrae]|uniref:Uncharacterized protein n=1 Tax=Nocardioides aquiterrae TaxID=203799 RepID=A0ABN1UDF0_9ACTN